MKISWVLWVLLPCFQIWEGDKKYEAVWKKSRNFFYFFTFKKYESFYMVILLKTWHLLKVFEIRSLKWGFAAFIHGWLALSTASRSRGVSRLCVASPNKQKVIFKIYFRFFRNNFSKQLEFHQNSIRKTISDKMHSKILCLPAQSAFSLPLDPFLICDVATSSGLHIALPEVIYHPITIQSQRNIQTRLAKFCETNLFTPINKIYRWEHRRDTILHRTNCTQNIKAI